MKNKLVPFLLVVAIIGSVVFIFKLSSDKQSLMSAVERLSNEKDNLVEENTTLKQKLSDYKSQNESLSSRLQEIEKALTKAQSERDEYRQQASSLQQENKTLRQRLSQISKKVNSISSGLVEIKSGVSQLGSNGSSDKYWQDVLRERAELKVKVNDLEKKIDDLLVKMDKIKEEKSKALLELSGLKKELAEGQSKLEFDKRTIDLLTKQLVRERERSRSVLEEFNNLRQDNINLRNSLNLANMQKAKILAKLKEIDDKKEALSDKIRSIEAILKEKSMELETLQSQLSSVVSSAKVVPPKKSVELPPIVVNAGGESSGAGMHPSYNEPASRHEESKQPSSSLEGKVIAVNQKERFVIVDLGKSAGLKVRDRLVVKRAGQQIASLSVIETRRDISACDINSGSNIKEGDQVVLVR